MAGSCSRTCLLSTDLGLTPRHIHIQLVPPLLTAGVQDYRHARFSSCFLPYLSVIPAAIALCILLIRAVSLLLPHRFWPEWSGPFIEEPEEQPNELEPKPKWLLGRLTGALLVVSLAGLALHTLEILRPPVQFQGVFFAISWVGYAKSSQ